MLRTAPLSVGCVAAAALLLAAPVMTGTVLAQYEYNREAPDERQRELEQADERQRELEEQSERQRELEQPSARQRELEDPSERQQELEGTD